MTYHRCINGLLLAYHQLVNDLLSDYIPIIVFLSSANRQLIVGRWSPTYRRQRIKGVSLDCHRLFVSLSIAQSADHRLINRFPSTHRQPIDDLSSAYRQLYIGLSPAYRRLLIFRLSRAYRRLAACHHFIVSVSSAYRHRLIKALSSDYRRFKTLSNLHHKTRLSKLGTLKV